MSVNDAQCDRIHAWLKTHGTTTIADWDREPACDGDSKITRLAARILDLEQKRQVPIDKSEFVTLGKSRVKLYRLKPQIVAVPVADVEQVGLFDLPSIPHYRQEAA